jgi:undecaprenyl diphosphate synthase
MALPVAVPHHIAIVMDGNGRWASKRFLPRLAGHKQGLEALKRMVAACAVRKVAVLTVFAFSSENWNRPAEEVSGLMDILVMALSRQELAQLQKEGVQLRFVGDRTALSERVRRVLHDAEAVTAANSRLILNVCFNFGGRWDIVTAAQRLADQDIPITQDSLSGALALAHCCDPDLVVRTGGEKRISNFLLWQSAYSELYFSDLLWPDFDEVALDAAITDFSARERRFGQTSTQVADKSAARSTSA